ncbi:MAG TPA: DUF3089 domain-containing protein [Clostridiales bacterium]|nr:DUF3089 domain-containing protein [Clostridiales bacterium]
MKKYILRTISVLLCGALAVTVLFGCSGGKNNSSATIAADSSASASQSESQQLSSQINLSDSKYNNPDNWAYNGIGEGKQADVFMVCPTVYNGNSQSFNMLLSDTETKRSFLGSLNMGRGVYEDSCRMYAPYYRQVGMIVYALQNETLEKPYFDIAYSDIRESFLYYMAQHNEGRPIILAGFSQGADMVLRLMKEFFTQEQYSKQLVAAYAVGWHFTAEEAQQYPQLRLAQGETDTGVIISYNSEEDYVTTSALVPDTTLGINPLNWKTDSTVADRSENLGACFTDNEGRVQKEIPEFTGAYMDSERGTLKVTDVDDTRYTAGFSTFGDGIYHVYDIEFFYRNLQKNVGDRINAFINQ